jgi:[acyl-carrier-protein] S-malonyltransferase
MSVAFVYPGTGARPGMAAALHASDPALLDRHLRLADEVTGLPVRRSCLNGTAEQLDRPDVAAPALLAFQLALTEMARSEGVEPALVAGHGLGEYAAAVAAGVLAAPDAMRLLVLASRLLGAAREDGDLQAVRGALARRGAALEWRTAAVPMAVNAFGGLVRRPEAIRTALVTQAGAPVAWAECRNALAAGGATAFLELGPPSGLGEPVGSRAALAPAAAA